MYKDEIALDPELRKKPKLTIRPYTLPGGLKHVFYKLSISDQENNNYENKFMVIIENIMLCEVHFTVNVSFVSVSYESVFRKIACANRWRATKAGQ